MIFKELMGLSPSSFSLVSCIIAILFKRESGLINKGIHLLFDILTKLFRVSYGLVHIIEKLLNWDSRHVNERE